jgi:Holliday junction resolvase-like predicted endonuclease
MNTIHLCIATGQNAANLIPIKQLDAQEVWILETPAMKAQRSGANLKLALEPYVPTVKCLAFDDSTPQSICTAAAKLANESLDGHEVVFHITGGTKLMVLAIHRELDLLNSGTGSYRTLYADTQNQTIDWMDAKPTQESMKDVLSLQDLLLLRGYRTTNDTRPAKDQQRAAARAAVSRFMGEQAQVLNRFFGTLAYKAQAASTGALQQHFDYPPGGPAAKLLSLASKHGLLQWSAGQSDFTFTDHDSTSFFAGGWAEEYVFLKMTGLLKPGQYAVNAKIVQNHTKTRNEIDVIAVKNNRALIIECKAKKQDEAQAAIYKLGQVVRQVGGLMSRGLYASARDVSSHDRSRAAEYGIDVLAGEELQNINQYLRDWAKS